jgi:hypothetical protein
MATNIGKIRLRRSTGNTPGSQEKLFEGQPAIEYRSGKTPRIKVGPLDNTETQTGTSWNSCPYVAPDADIYTDTQIVSSNSGHTVSKSPNSTDAVLRNIVVSTSEPSASGYIEGTVLLIIE